MRVVALASLLLLEDVCPQNIQQFLYVLPRVFFGRDRQHPVARSRWHFTPSCSAQKLAGVILDAVAEAGRCVQSFDVDAISVSQPKYWDVSFEELVARVRKSNVESLD